MRGNPITLSIGMTPQLANAFLAGNLLHLLAFARAITCEDRQVDNDPLGSGRPSFRLKKLRIDIATLYKHCTYVSYHTVTCYFRTVNFRCCNN